MNESSATSNCPMHSTRNRRSRPLKQRLLCAVLAVAHAVTVMGFPVPSLAGEQDSTPYICRGHQCGCRSAQQCWNNCCCFTREQRIAWATANHVTPPEYFVQSAEPPTKKRSCCEQHEHCHEIPVPAKADPHDHSPAVNAPKCRGVATLWLATGAMTPPPSPVQWAYEWVVVGSVNAAYYCTSEICSLPAVPPPRA